MKQIDYKQAVELEDQKQVDQAVLICYYHYKETGESQFEPKGIQTLFSDFGFNAINASRVKKALTEKHKMRTIKGMQSTLEFIPTILQELESRYSSLWNNTETIESNSELIDESKFCGKRGFLDKIIKQINHTYSHNCFDACAVLMRRLFEILLVLTYQNTGIESAISKPDGTHFMLEAIVKDAVQNKALGIPARISKNFDAFREVGNNSAHSITYTAGQKDITDIQRDYRVMMEDLYNRAGLI